MTEKQTLVGTSTPTAAAMAGLRAISLCYDQHRNAIPESLVLDVLRQLEVGHIGYNTFHPLALGALPDTLEISQHDNSIVLLSLIDYLAGNLVADGVDLSLLGMPYLFDDIKELPFLESLSQPSIVSPNSSGFLAQKLGLDTITTTDSCQIPLSQIYSKDRLLFDNRFNNVLLNCEMDKPRVLVPDKLCFPQGTISRDCAMWLEGKPDAALNTKAGELEPVCRQLGISLFKADNITAKDNRVMFVFGGFNLLLESLCLLLGSRIKIGFLPMQSLLKRGVFLLQNLSLSVRRVYNFRLNCLFYQHLLFTLSLNIFADSLVRNIPCRGDKVAVSPHRGHSEKLWKLSPQIIRTSTLKCLKQLVYRQLGIAGYKKMHMVWLYLQRQYLHLLLPRHILKDGLQPILDAVHQYLASPLGAPDKVVVYEIDLIPRMFVFHVCRLSHFYTKVNCLRKENEPHSSPALKCGAF